ncbi:MAG TPA: hypothetical protein VM822_24615 [Pseudolabrys sp.]|nr:hypothetical protein [Pseudolabrys sp.]
MYNRRESSVDVAVLGGVIDLDLLSNGGGCHWMLELSNTLAAVFGFTSKAIVAALGTSSRNSSKRFGPNAPAKKVTPVMLPSGRLGRLRLLTNPRTTGSLPTANTMGVVCVALRQAPLRCC